MKTNNIRILSRCKKGVQFNGKTYKVIEDREHAEAVLSASRRHRLTDYESRLDEGRELAAIGEIDKKTKGK